MVSKDFKQLALKQLQGKRTNITITLLAASLIVVALGVLLNMPAYLYNAAHGFEITDMSTLPPIPSFLSGISSYLSFAAGCLLEYGVCRYMLNFVRSGRTNSADIISILNEGSTRIWHSIFLGILIMMFIFLWSLLLIFPGIIAAYRYAMAYYIMADDENIKPIDAINISKKMMNGYKSKLFCLHMSFIGWILLCILTFGIGFIFLRPYFETAQANFYEYLRGIYESNREHSLN